MILKIYHSEFNEKFEYYRVLLLHFIECCTLQGVGNYSVAIGDIIL